MVDGRDKRLVNWVVTRQRATFLLAVVKDRRSHAVKPTANTVTCMSALKGHDEKQVKVHRCPQNFPIALSTKMMEPMGTV